MTDHDTGRPRPARRSDDDVRSRATAAEVAPSGTGSADRRDDGGSGRASVRSTTEERGEPTDDGADSVRTSELFEVLAHRDRRVVLSALCATDGELGVESLATELVRRTDTVSPATFDDYRPGDADASAADSAVSAGALRSASVSLVHNHLPRLVAAGLVRFDRDGDRVRPTDEFYRIEPALETLLETGASVECQSAPTADER